MKRTILFGTILSAALATGVSAQQTPPTSTADSPSQQAASGQQITMTGCLKSGDASAAAAGSAATGATGTAGATGATGATPGSRSEGYILTNAKAGSGSSSTGAAGSPGAATGATAGTTGSASMATYKLSGGDQSDLTKYANSQVEVRGTLMSSGQSSTGATSTTGAAGSTSASRSSGSDSNMPTLRVSSVRQIASSCSQ